MATRRVSRRPDGQQAGGGVKAEVSIVRRSVPLRNELEHLAQRDDG
jgi:hypothetical protein